MFAKHIQDTLDFYKIKYDTLVFIQDGTGSSAGSVPSFGEKTCRYCNKGEPDVSFKTDCHALPHFIGNRTLFAEDECDSCNQFFGIGGGIEDHFAKWSLPYRVISQIRGKNGFPSIKREHAGWRIDASLDGLKMSMREDEIVFNVDEQNKWLDIRIVRDTHIPIAVYKAFVKMALAIMPRDELSKLTPVLDWLRNPDHTIAVDGQFPQILGSFIPGNAPKNTITAVLCKRHVNELSLPYLVFVLLFGNYAFQIFLPSPQTLQNHDFTATIFPLLYGPDDAKPAKADKMNLTGTTPVKNELTSFRILFSDCVQTGSSVIANHETT